MSDFTTFYTLLQLFTSSSTSDAIQTRHIHWFQVTGCMFAIATRGIAHLMGYTTHGQNNLGTAQGGGTEVSKELRG